MPVSFTSPPPGETGYDVAIVGGGPAGAACAAFCAAGGLRTLLLEREKFPREKVCGDCLNPAAWPVLDRLGISDAVRALPCSPVGGVEFIGADGLSFSVPLPAGACGEIGIRRREFDGLLLTTAGARGADVRESSPVGKIARQRAGWIIESGGRSFTARVLVAADGRNSMIARLLGILPRTERDRVALQTHFRAPADFGKRVVLQFLPWGYGGLATIGDGFLNLCLVARPEHLASLRAWAAEKYRLPESQAWRSITPLSRKPLPPARDGLLFVGDAARAAAVFAKAA